jgi:integrase
MATRRLTEAGIKRLSAAQSGKRVEVSDTVVPGLVLRVTDKGHKSFCLYYYDGAKKHRRLTLGRWPDVGLVDARTLAVDARKAVKQGTDPRLIQKDKDAAVRSLSAAAALFLDRYVKVINRSSTARETERKLNRYVIPVLGNRAIDSIGRRDIAALVQKISDKNGRVMADRVLATLSKLFNWAMTQPEYIDVLQASPVIRGMSPGHAKKRDRVLTEDEVARFWQSIEPFGYPFGPFFRLLLLTGQRRSELAEARWDQFDLETGIWRLPAASTKADRAHEIPLSALALRDLEKLPRFAGPFVFTTMNGERPISGFSKAKARLDPVMRPDTSWRLHDLRRTFATLLEDLEVPRTVIAALLNHAGNSVTDVYTRADLRKSKQDAVNRLASHVTELVGEGASV